MEKDSAEKKLATTEADSVQDQALSGARAKKGGILAALLRSPMVGADLDLSRSPELGRKTKL